MSDFTEFRADGWPLCPNCGEDELSAPTAWNGTDPRPTIQQFIDAGIFCMQCGWRKEAKAKTEPHDDGLDWYPSEEDGVAE